MWSRVKLINLYNVERRRKVASFLSRPFSLCLHTWLLSLSLSHETVPGAESLTQHHAYESPRLLDRTRGISPSGRKIFHILRYETSTPLREMLSLVIIIKDHYHKQIDSIIVEFRTNSKLEWTKGCLVSQWYISPQASTFSSWSRSSFYRIWW